MDTTSYYSKYCPIKGHWIKVPEGTPGARKVTIRNNLPLRTTSGKRILDPFADSYEPATAVAAPSGNVVPFKRRT